MLSVFDPEVIVVQCGADMLFGDPIDPSNPLNVTVSGYLDCMDLLISSKKPMVLLGGGQSSLFEGKSNCKLTKYF